MEILPLLIKEMEQEAATTRKFMKLVPMDKPDFKPHEKSMPLMNLATHIAEITAWPKLILSTSELNFADAPYAPTVVNSTAELETLLDNALNDFTTALSKADEQQLNDTWALKMGNHTIATWTKYEAIRHAMAQHIHHRAQLGVYFRLLGIPVPASYDPSADDQNF